MTNPAENYNWDRRFVMKWLRSIMNKERLPKINGITQVFLRLKSPIRDVWDNYKTFSHT
jgi:hypothetical protein